MNKKHIFIGILIVIALHYIFYLLGTIKITARFQELEPFRHNISVYYKGFRLGKTTKIRPGKDYQSTLIDMRIKDKNLKLPANTEIVLRRKDKKDYIELVYPNSPYIETIKHGTTIDGRIGVNFENFIEEQARNGGLDEIKDNVNNTVISAGQTFNALTEMLDVMTEILKEAQPSINSTVKNFENASENLSSITKSLKNSNDKGYIEKTLYNLQETSSNFAFSSKNFGSFTTNLNNESSILINCILKNLNITVNNINKIITGIGKTLEKRFGGLKLFFGKSIES